MAESILIEGTTRSEKYESLLNQLKILIGDEQDLISILSNTTAAIKETFGFFWIGFYIVRGEVLKLGPFQGSLACMEIGLGRGVCGTSWKNKETLVVPNVDEFPGHIACSSLSKSEIVVPILKGDTVIAVLDIDSTLIADFTETDANYLNQLCQWLSIYF
ncbi:MAG: Free methionine-R-sulfoxide reductase [Bacteroidota bacterium]|jgi:L-methionine (R)-S-oxide reductase